MAIVGLDGRPVGGEDSFVPWTLSQAIEAIQPAMAVDAVILITLKATEGFSCAAKFPPALKKPQVLEFTKRVTKLTKAWLVECGMVEEDPTEDQIPPQKEQGED